MPLCALADQTSAASEAALKQRVEARWHALIAGDYAAAYRFETPAYRALYKPTQYGQSFGYQVQWKVVQVRNIRYDGPDTAKVTVTITYTITMAQAEKPTEVSTDATERWIREKGQWWHVQPQKLMSGGSK